MSEHRLDGSITQPFWDRDAPPRLTIDSGDVVVFECPEPCGQVTPNWTADDIADHWDKSKVHALLGPVDVRGATAGGSLDVEILDIQHHGWGWSALIPGFGLLHEQFPEPHLVHWAIDDSGCRFGDRDIIVPCEPFVGCIGVAPAETGRFDTIPPRGNGGNLDLRDVRIGATIRLPVHRDGAGLQLGDGHAAQGDGELCGTAIEAPLTVTARITARPDVACDGIIVDAPPRDPWHGQAGHQVTTAVGSDLRGSCREAVSRMVDWTAESLGLIRPDAMILCSAVVDLSISQAVNEPHWTVAARFPKSLLTS